MALPMSFLSLGSGRMELDMWWLHYGGSIPCDHRVLPKGLSNGTQRRVMCNIQAQMIRTPSG
jgi:hypothetical protein